MLTNTPKAIAGPSTFCFFVLLICFPLLSPGQQVFSPVVTDSVWLKELSGAYSGRFKEELKQLPSKYRKDYETVYTERFEHIKAVFDSKEVYTDKEAVAYLNKLLALIVQSNPQLDTAKIKGFFSRSAVPNAAYIGQGIFLFNLGLFEKLENESQAAFVICHELAHFYLQHGENSIRTYVETLNGEAMQRELRDIKKSEYNRNARLEKLAKGFTYNSRRHSRNHEAQADSMALALLKRTPFAASEAITALALLDNIDSVTVDMATCLPATFNSAAYPFKPKWIAKPTGMLVASQAAVTKKDAALADSLKTHPDCSQRILLLQPALAGTPTGGNKNPVDAAAFKSIRDRAGMEATAFAFERKQYTATIYLALTQLQQRPAEPFLVTQLGQVFNAWYDAQKSHTLSRYIEMPSPKLDDNYNVIARFVQNLYLEDVAAVGYHYLGQFAPKLMQHKTFEDTYKKSGQLVNN